MGNGVGGGGQASRRGESPEGPARPVRFPASARPVSEPALGGAVVPGRGDSVADSAPEGTVFDVPRVYIHLSYILRP